MSELLKRSTDGKVTFRDSTHVYKLGKRKLTSVTTLIKDYFKPFDAKEIARSLCKWHPKYKELGIRKTLKLWKDAAEHGTRTHFLLENFVLTGEDYLVPGDPKASKYENRDINKYTHARDYLRTVLRSVSEPITHTEIIIYDEELGLAGQIDLIIERNAEVGTERVYDLLDYKTNDKMDTAGYKGEKAKEPISELPDCSFSKYTLQLSIYAYMLERQGYKIGTLTLLHLQEDKTVPMNVEYRKDLVEKLIEHDKKTK